MTYHFIPILASITTKRNKVVDTEHSDLTECQLLMIDLNEDELIFESQCILGEIGKDWAIENIGCKECRYATLDAVHYWRYNNSQTTALDEAIKFMVHQEKQLAEADGP